VVEAAIDKRLHRSHPISIDIEGCWDLLVIVGNGRVEFRETTRTQENPDKMKPGMPQFAAG